MNPKVSVVMAVWQGERYLEQAVESILSQTWTDYEFIIVDDGSTDSTACILQKYAACDPRIVLLNNPRNVGLTKSLNQALSVSQGTYIARQDADDISLPQRLESQVTFLERHPDIGLLGSAYHVINTRGETLATHVQPPGDAEIRWQMLFHNAFCHTSVMWRRAVLGAKDTLYEEQCHYSQDYALWVKLLRRSSAANLHIPLVAHRVHDASIEATTRGAQQQTATSIAIEEICRLLGIELVDISDVTTLREWYYRWPERLGPSQYRLCFLYLRILEAFVRQDCVPKPAALQIRRGAMERMLDSVSFDRFGELWRIGLIQAMLKSDAPLVMGYVLRQCWSQVKRGLRSLIHRPLRRHTRGGV